MGNSGCGDGPVRDTDGAITRRAMLFRVSGAALAAAAAPPAGASAAAGQPAPSPVDGAPPVAGAPSSSAANAVRSGFVVGPLDVLAPGSRIAFDTHRICVVREGNRVGALSTTCTHLGCSVSLAEGGFACPCHRSRFDLQGAVTHGPAGAPLAWHEVRRTPEGDLEVDTGVIVVPGTYLTV